MPSLEYLQKAFLELVRAGLWEKEARLSQFGKVDYEEIMRLAEEQSLVGLVTAGLEQVKDVKVPHEILLQFIGSTLQIEQQNSDMNKYIGVLMGKLQKAEIYAILVKGQGIAQCYEKPLWRASGDVDLYLSNSNYQAAKEFLIPLASHVDNEEKNLLHMGMTIDGWVVELHGTMYGEISRRMNKGLDEVHRDIFYGGAVRSWNNNGVQVFLPSADNDVLIVFTHFLQHFFVEGVGLRQICDWCRLLWRYKDVIDVKLLEKRLCRMGLMTEWRVFAALAVEHLGMAADTMPFYDSRFKVKGEKALKRVLKTGNFGHNKDLSYRTKFRGVKYKVVATWRRFWDFITLIPIFPIDAPTFFAGYGVGKKKGRKK